MHFLIDLYNWVSDLVTNRLTSTRAGYLDRLDAAITTRAPASGALSDTVWTPQRAGYLDGLGAGAIAQETTPILTKPMTSGLSAMGSCGHTASALLSNSMSGVSGGSQAVSTYTDVLNYTGAGVVSFVAGQIYTAVDGYIKLVIDGTTVFDGTLGSQTALFCAAIVGAVTFDSGGVPNSITFEPIAFKTSIQIQVKSQNGSAAYAFWKIRKTG